MDWVVSLLELKWGAEVPRLHPAGYFISETFSCMHGSLDVCALSMITLGETMHREHRLTTGPLQRPGKSQSHSTEHH